MELSLGTSQQESPGTVGIQQRNVGSSGEGVGFDPLGHSIVGTSQSSWFGLCEPLPRCEQRPKWPVRSNPESGRRARVDRGHLGGHSW